MENLSILGITGMREFAYISFPRIAGIRLEERRIVMECVEPIRDKGKISLMKKLLFAEDPRNYLLFVLGINSGLRISDLLKLRVEDVLEPDGSMRERITLREKKTGKSKDFPLSDNARSALKQYFKSLEGREKKPMELFPSRKGGALGRVQAYRILNRAARIAGISGRIGTHTLRKTFGYWAYKQGQDIVMIQRLFNHSSPSVTLGYIGITQEELDNVYIHLNL